MAVRNPTDTSALSARTSALAGGSAGMVLKKNTNADFDFSWQPDLQGAGAASANVTSQNLSVISNAVSVLSQGLSVETANRVSADADLSNKVSAVSALVSTVASALSVRVDTVSQAVSVLSQQLSALSQAHSVLSADHVSLKDRVSSVSSLVSTTASALSARIDTVSNAVSVLSAAFSAATSVLSTKISSISNIISTLRGGTTGQVLKKNTENDFDWAWNTDLQGGGGGASADVTSQHISQLSQALSVVSSQVSVLRATGMLLSLQNVDASAVSAGCPVYLGASAGTFKKAGINGPACIGLVYSGSVAVSAVGLVLIGGQLSLASAQWDNITSATGGLTPGSTYYLTSVSGTLSTAAPVTGPFSQVGFAVSPTLMVLGFSDTDLNTTSILNALSQQVSVISQQVSVLSQQVSVLSADHVSLKDRVSANSALISVITSALVTRIDTVSQQVSVISQQLSVLSQLHSALSQAHSALSADQVSLKDRVSAISSDQTSIRDRVSAISSDQTSIRDRVSAVSALVSTVASALSVRVDTVSAAAAAVSADLTSVKDVVSIISSLVSATASALSARIDTVSNAVSVLSAALSTEVSALSQRLSLMSNRLSNLSDRVSALEAAPPGTGSVTSNEVSVLAKGILSLQNVDSVTMSAGQPVGLFTSADTIKLISGISVCVGLIVDGSVAVSAIGRVQSRGTVVLTSAQWDDVAGTTGGLTPGTRYYTAPTRGQLTATSALNNQYVGIARSPNALELNIGWNGHQNELISLLFQQISTISQQVSALSQAHSVLSADHVSLQNRVSALSTDHTSLLNRVSGISAAVSSLSADLTSVKDRVSANSALISTVASALSARIDTVSNAVSVLSAAFSAATSVLSTKISAISALVSTLRGGTTGQVLKKNTENDFDWAWGSGAATSTDVTSDHLSQLSQAISALSADHLSLKDRVSANSALISTVASALSARIDVVSDAASIVSAAGAATSLEVVSIRDRISAVSALVSTVASALSVRIDIVSDALSNEISNRISANNALSVRVDTVSQAVSVLNQVVSAVSVVANEIILMQNVDSVVVSAGAPVFPFTSADTFKLASSDYIIGLVADSNIAISAVGRIQRGGTMSLTSAQWDDVVGTTGGLTPGTRYYSTSVRGKLTTVSSLNCQFIGVGRTPNAMELRIGWNPHANELFSTAFARIDTISQQVSVLSSGFGGMQMKVLQDAETISTSGAMSNVSGMAISVAAGGTYQVEGKFVFHASIVSTIGFGMTYPQLQAMGMEWNAFVSSNSGAATISLGAGGRVVVYVNEASAATRSGSAVVSLVSIASASFVHYVQFEGLFNVSAAGTIQLQARCSASPGFVILQGAYIRAYKLR